MKFIFDESESCQSNSELIYRSDEYSFDFYPAAIGSCYSIIINDINIDLDRHGMITSAWGICPKTTWIEKDLVIPQAFDGAVFVVSDEPFQKGIVQRVNSLTHYVPVFIDNKSGWVNIKLDDALLITANIAPGMMIGIGPLNSFSSLWLRARTV